jgi:hypothetical protein
MQLYMTGLAIALVLLLVVDNSEQAGYALFHFHFRIP